MQSVIEQPVLYMKLQVRKKSGRTWIVTPDGSNPVFEETKVDNTLLKALVKAHLWQRELDKGKYETPSDLARSKDIAVKYVRQILNLTYLSPSMKISIIDGKQPRDLRLQDLISGGVNLLWDKKDFPLNAGTSSF